MVEDDRVSGDLIQEVLHECGFTILENQAMGEKPSRSWNSIPGQSICC